LVRPKINEIFGLTKKTTLVMVSVFKFRNQFPSFNFSFSNYRTVKSVLHYQEIYDLRTL
jgi:hypothetical protein